MKKLILTLVFPLLFSLQAQASHILGGEISYEYVGNNQYDVLMTIFWEQTAFDPGATTTVQLNSASCNVSSTIPLTRIGSPISVSSFNDCVSNTGYSPMVNYYHGLVTINQLCTDYVFSWTLCCRSGGITNMVGSSGFSFYFSAELDNTQGQNSAPTFNTVPMSGFCVGSNIVADYSVFDSNGDSLYYELVPAKDGANTTVAYASGFSGIMPLGVAVGDTIVLDKATGTFSFVPNIAMSGVVSIRVSEYRVDTNYSGYYKVGSCSRDFLIVVTNNCVPGVMNGMVLDNSTVGYDNAQSTDEFPVLNLNCGANLVNLKFSNDIQCSSIAADGTDFFMINPQQQVSVVNSVGFSCSSSQTNELNLGLLDPMCDPGTYKLVIRQGSDGNSLLNVCGIESQLIDTIYIHVSCGSLNISGNMTPSAGVLESYSASFSSTTASLPTWTVVNGTIFSGQGTNNLSVLWNAPISNCELTATVTDGYCSFSKTIDFGTVGLNENGDDSGIELYPNPASNIVLLRSNKGELNGTLVLLDLSGKVVYSAEISGERELNLDIQSIKPGLYFAHLYHENSHFIEKLIIQ